MQRQPTGSRRLEEAARGFSTRQRSNETHGWALLRIGWIRGPPAGPSVGTSGCGQSWDDPDTRAASAGVSHLSPVSHAARSAGAPARRAFWSWLERPPRPSHWCVWTSAGVSAPVDAFAARSETVLYPQMRGASNRSMGGLRVQVEEGPSSSVTPRSTKKRSRVLVTGFPRGSRLLSVHGLKHTGMGGIDCTTADLLN